jgi:hypothetical protein
MCQATLSRAVIVAAIALASAAGSPAARAQPQIDVTGVWAFEVTTQIGTGTPQVTFKQEGEKLTGRYSSAVLGEAELTGTVKGNAIEFSLTGDAQGNAITLTFTGTVEDNNSMKGKVSFVGYGEGTFAGKRK